MNNLTMYKSPFPAIISDNKENTYIGNSLVTLATYKTRDFEKDSISPSSVWEAQIDFQNQTNSPKPKSENNQNELGEFQSPTVSEKFTDANYSGVSGSAKKRNYEKGEVDAIPFSLNSPTANQLKQTYSPPISNSSTRSSSSTCESIGKGRTAQ